MTWIKRTSWPDDIQLIGFDPKLGTVPLDYIRTAVWNGTVTLISGPEVSNRDDAHFVFDWLGFRYEMLCDWDAASACPVVRSVEKIAKVDEVEDDVQQHGQLRISTPRTVVIEDYRQQRLFAHNPQAGSW